MRGKEGREKGRGDRERYFDLVIFLSKQGEGGRRNSYILIFNY